MSAVAGEIDQRASASRARKRVWNWTRVWFVLVTLVLAVGWFLPLDRYVSPRQGVGYWLGIVGGSLMLLLLVYPARKRMPSMAFLGNARIWFQIHMALGIIGPLCILYHCLYRLGAANSNVALICMLVVSGSGVMGRYLYARIHHGLYGRQASLAEFRAESERLRAETSGVARLLPQLAGSLEQSERRIAMNVPLVPKPLSASLSYRFERVRLRRLIDSGLRGAAAQSSVIAGHERSLKAAARRYVDERLRAARRVAEFEACARLFGLWHVLHIPLFFMLLLAGVVHVVAVHVY